MARKLRIGIDIDDVLNEFSKEFFKYYNLKHKTNFSFNDSKEYGYKLLGMAKEETIKELDEFFKTEHFLKLNPILCPIEGSAVESIEKLHKEGHKLFVISARKNELNQHTLEWIEKHFPNKFLEIHLTNQIIDDKLNTKDKIAENLKLEVFIEDILHYAIPVSQKGIQVLLFTRPWNFLDKTIPNITRIHSWPEALEKISILSKKLHEK